MHQEHEVTIEQDGLSNNDEIEVVPEIGVEMEVEGEPEAAMQDPHEELDPDDHDNPPPLIDLQTRRRTGRPKQYSARYQEREEKEPKPY